MKSIMIRTLSNGKEIHINPLTYGRAKLCIGTQGSLWYDDEW